MNAGIVTMMKLQQCISEYVKLSHELAGYQSTENTEWSDEQRIDGVQQVRRKLQALLVRTAELGESGYPLCEEIVRCIGEPDAHSEAGSPGLMQFIENRERLHIDADQLLRGSDDHVA